MGDKFLNHLLRDGFGDPIQDPMAPYRTSDEPTQAEIEAGIDPLYYGFVDVNGAWIIHKRNFAAGTNRYCRGVSDYALNWANRESLAYTYFNYIF
jgi:hypothetical protein